jgi:hypothetical protein
VWGGLDPRVSAMCGQDLTRMFAVMWAGTHMAGG